MESFDVVVIGAGPGGYVSAIRAAQLGKNVAIVEKSKTLGGTCLNVGCIPSKALLESSELYHQTHEKLADHGITAKSVDVDYGKMVARKDKVVSQITAGVDFLMKKNKITRLEGLGSFVDPHVIAVTADDGSVTEVRGENVIVATGSKPFELPSIPFDGKRIISSREALELTEVPKHIVVIGAGAIGLEMGSVFGRLGAKVTVIEFMASIIPTMDRALGKALMRSLKKINFTFHLGTKVTAATVKGKSVAVTAEDSKGEELSIKGDYLLVAVGRAANTEGLNAEAAGLLLDDRGRIEVDPGFCCGPSHIYAIGDVIRGPMLAHKAEEEGVAVAEIICNEKPHVNYDVIPGVVYTWPEVAAVGKTEEQLKEAGIEYGKGEFPFKANGRAVAGGDADGFVKVLTSKATDEILGIHMFGPRCADLISEAVVAMEYRASAEDIRRIVHAHPTFSEALKEASLLAYDGKALNF